MASSAVQASRAAELLELGLLVRETVESRNRTEGSFGDCRCLEGVGHGENVLLDLGGKLKHGHDLSDTRAGDPLTPGYLRLRAYLTCVELALPLERLLEEDDNMGRARLLGPNRRATGRR